MQKWEVSIWTVSGNFTGYRVTRVRNNQLEIAHGEAATTGSSADLIERERCHRVCDTIATFLNRWGIEKNIDLYVAADVQRAVSTTFPHFQDDADVTPEAVREIGREYMEMQMSPGPKEIGFIGLDGDAHKIVFEAGDHSVGINDGWVQAE